jgi:hypothetical protein
MLVVACAARAQTSGPASADGPPNEIQRRVLLASLSAYSPWTRQDAQEKLNVIGEPVEAGLVLAAASAVDDDARQRARVVLDEIRTRRRIRGLMEPTRVTLHFDRTPARRVLASLYVRAGWESRVFPPDPWDSAGDEPVTVHLDDVPFWDAVRRVEETAGLTVIDAGWGTSFVKRPAGVARRRESVHGPYRVVADDGDGMPGSIGSLKVFLEPKIRVVSHARMATLPAGDDRADGPLAHAWLADPRVASRVVAANDDVLDVQLPLVGLVQPVRQVKGTIAALLVAREESFDELRPSYGNGDLGGRRFTWRLLTPTADAHILELGESSVQPILSSALGRNVPKRPAGEGVFGRAADLARRPRRHSVARTEREGRW